jgi:hypothetical protein
MRFHLLGFRFDLGFRQDNLRRFVEMKDVRGVLSWLVIGALKHVRPARQAHGLLVASRKQS